MNDYERIARIIRYLDETHGEQPALEDLAAQAGLSRHHFHRLFARWAGVTPKDFLQCLTLAHARRLLRTGASVLDASLDAGLSGPGRLHDLCIKLEAATPGEIKSGGAGWTVTTGVAESPFGRVLIGLGPRGICHLAFIDSLQADGAMGALRAAWPRAGLLRDDRKAQALATQIFEVPADEGGSRALRAYVHGTPFQVRVWRALLRVPPGRLVSYGRLARAVGHPNAARAVGMAAGGNPLAFLIPCHRVIRETGVLGGYRWGETRKRAMIARETCVNPVVFADHGG